MSKEEKNNNIDQSSPDENLEELKAVTEEASAEETVTEEASAEETVTEEAPAAEAVTEEAPAGIDVDFIIGKKIGMTRLFDESGTNIPVTIIEAGPCPIVQIKTIDKDGYSAFQLGFLENKNSNKSKIGHFNKSGIKNTTSILKEFRVESDNNELLGKEVTVNSFSIGDRVVITGNSKGKGFAGHMRRHNFSGGRASHGKNSVMRKAGSIGAGTSPGRVWKGTRMAGRMGGDNTRVSNLKVIRIDNENNLLFIKGAVPGASKSIVYIEK